MSNQPATVNALFDLAIMAEQAAEELYRGLAACFAHHPQVAGFWREVAADEAGHAQCLETIRSNLSAEQLAAPANPAVFEQASWTARFSVARALARIRNLEDAYHLASELENGETNSVFESLTSDLALAQMSRSFLRAQLSNHVAKIAAFPDRFGDKASRLRIKALDDQDKEQTHE